MNLGDRAKLQRRAKVLQAGLRCQRTKCTFDEVADVLFPDKRIIARGEKFGAVRDLDNEHAVCRYQLS
jgi:hypothetical protein